MKSANIFPINHNASFSERLLALKKHKGFLSDRKLAESIFETMGYKTDNEDINYGIIESIRKRIVSHLKKGANPKLEFIKEYCEFFECDADYLLGYSDFPTKENQTVYEITGLNNEAISTLKILNMNGGCTTVGHNEIDTLNILLSDTLHIISFLNGLQDFINTRYKIPVYHTGKNVIETINDETSTGVCVPQCVVPDNDYDVLKDRYGFDDIYLLTLAQDKNKPYENYQIPLTDDFFESVALKKIEKTLHDIRKNYKERIEVDETT